jgi:hypothetical protein
MLLVALVVLMYCGAASARRASDLELARLLANPDTRHRAVYDIVMSGHADLPALLSLARDPPDEVDKDGLFVGLADVLGRLRAKDAIPFLIENINLQRYTPAHPNVWIKSDEVILERLPAVVALIRIGPDASRAVIREPWGSRPRDDLDDHVAAVFVVAHIRGVPEARSFLVSAVNNGIGRDWAEEALRLLDEDHK